MVIEAVRFHRSMHTLNSRANKIVTIMTTKIAILLLCSENDKGSPVGLPFAL